MFNMMARWQFPGAARDGDEAAPGQHYHGKELNACQNRHMRTNEVRPAPLFAVFGSRRDTERRRMLPTV
jgi:hypothetical protein